MNELKMYVDTLFSKYPETQQIKELKEEIFGNLESKKADLLAKGLDEISALHEAKQSITSIDYLIDGNKNVFINKFKLELVQWGLIYLLVAWIITIPLQIGLSGTSINTLLLIATIIVGIGYLVLYNKKGKTYLNTKKFVNITPLSKQKKIVWIIWILFIVAVTLSTTAIHFGSNIWFLRPIHIDGPYQFAIIAIRFILPIITIVVPLMWNTALKVIEKYEVGDMDEN
ncbi:permease prefix domain 1-containing protein [Heyndrickxia sp. NPDC080065]|uniref:permease prefix domain 1-containing protein n=1 Tax=Heyndrickxia sp. NPDC080065 TaxID=3390568 RepID=UPI003D03C796